VPIDAVTVEGLHADLLRSVRLGVPSTVLHVNAHAINLAHRHEWFAAALRGADLVFCDGYGVLLGARLLGQVLPERITYADWAWQLAGFCEAEGISLYLLGARPGVASTAADRLRDRHPALEVRGTGHGYFDKRAGSLENEAVIAALNRARPDVVVVGFGMPLQERWLCENRPRIEAPVVLSGGAVFDYVSGRLRRPPRWMTDHGLEWLGRLAIEPRRLLLRYLIGNPLFLLRVLRERAFGSGRPPHRLAPPKRSLKGEAERER
jgi:N-acetylglucosaminyldiphosphoundecaprenol N-acetyl-beta-D-mannosaminyltransferase